MARVVSITKKGQATITKELRDKFRMKVKVLVLETSEGVLLKPLPTPESDFGSLRGIFGKSSRELLKDARAPDVARDERLRRKQE